LALELLKMFLADARLTAAILVLVGIVALMLRFSGVDALVGGAVLLIGSLFILVAAIVRETRQRQDL
jgi:hypothetical protein